MVLKKYPQYKDYAKNILIKANMASLTKLMTFKSNCYKDYEKKKLKEVCEMRRFFIPATENNKKLFFIITHHLYGFLKNYKRIKCFIKKS